MLLQDFIREQETLVSRAGISARTALFGHGQQYMSEMKEMSPVDSTEFRSRWALSLQSLKRSTYHKLVITNSTPYGIYLDEGAPFGGPPWFFPTKRQRDSADINTDDGFKSKSGKLIVKNGRVWAGGLSPYGHVVGGITDTVIFENERKLLRLANDVADGIVAAI